MILILILIWRGDVDCELSRSYHTYGTFNIVRYLDKVGTIICGHNRYVVIVVLGITFLCRTRVGAWCAKYSQYSWVIVPTIHKVGPHGVQNIHITYGLCKIYYGELKAKDSVQNLLWGASTQRGGVQFMGSLFSSLYLAFIWFV